MGFGPGLPGLQLVIGPGVGCGVGFGFGYGYGMGRGRGIAYQGNLQGRLPSEDEIATLIDKFAMNTKTLVEATYKMIHKGKGF
ncbi:hypothetical protein RHGRI_033011 [Rhododendron griersonianum]|uniref:Uncharacterized protein n=1 Tax=Rhododendron griersonianum TaxID=479676 RepID=A0AAV6HVL9_9ERIC|nr:hypothetical protein RHGRI_033011 [Rhododendron griersonianum]